MVGNFSLFLRGKQGLFKGIHKSAKAGVKRRIITLNPAVFFEDFRFDVFALLDQLRGRINFGKVEFAQFAFEFITAANMAGDSGFSHCGGVVDGERIKDFLRKGKNYFVFQGSKSEIVLGILSLLARII